MKRIFRVLGSGAWRPMAMLASLWVAPTTHGQSRAEPPPVLAFQGRVVGPNGSPIGSSGPASYPMVFRIFDNHVDGRLLWSELQTVAVLNGGFSVLLGEGSKFGNEPRPALPSVFHGTTASDRFVAVTIRGVLPGESDATVTPRTRLVSGAFSLVASRARTAQGIANGSGQPVLVPAGDKVGVNKASPEANLDVASSMRVESMEAQGPFDVGGRVEGAAFHGHGMAPVGSILMWTGSVPPKGWVLCDGTQHGGVRTPDLRGRFVLAAGAGGGLTQRNTGESGGVEAHALTAAQIPAHSHTVGFSFQTSDASSGGHSYRAAQAGNLPWHQTGRPTGGMGYYLANRQMAAAGSHHHAVTIPGTASSTGGMGRPHNTMPPFYALAFIMRVE